ncbi:MAG: PAS domain-containing sensor histidine kinase, partial [Ignavibacteriaceae bacterium]|nr:PAS domain-containing sensor histidine kinase [Ignavibacteriaceae bacterium]
TSNNCNPFHFENLFNLASEKFIITDKKFNLIRINKSLKELFGFTETEISGKNFLDLIADKDKEQIKTILYTSLNERHDVIFVSRSNTLSLGERFLRWSLNYSADNCYFSAQDVTEQIETEKELLLKKEKFQKLVENSTDVIMRFDREFRHLYVNPVSEKIFGISYDNFIGKNHEQLGFPKADYEYWDSEITKVFETKKPIKELTSIFDGTVWVDWRLEPEFDADGNVVSVLSVTRDVTEIIETRNKLRESEEYYRKYFEDNQTVQLRIDPDSGNIVDANLAAEKYYGYSHEELINLNICDLSIRPKEEILDTIQKILKNEQFYLEVKHRKKDGSIRDVEIYSSAIIAGGKKFIQPIIFDITDRKQAADLIKKQNEELKLLNSEKDKLFAIIAHDLRSPFHAFLNLTEIIIEEFDELSKEEILEINNALLESAKKTYDLLGELLDWGRFNQGVMEYNPVALNLYSIIEHRCETLKNNAILKDIKVNIDIDKLINVSADRKMLSSVITNLLSNAIKFTPRGGKIEISAELISQNFVRISIKDSGIGIPESMINKLFKMQERTGRKGTEGESSSGLGLLLCKEFVEKMGGTISVQSKEGEGSLFIYTLPVVI